jgi:hypothetical protein
MEHGMNEHDRVAGVDLSLQTTMLRMISGFWLSRALSVAVKLGIADLLKEGPKSIDELAQATNTHAPSLYRVLRALAGEGIYTEDGNGRFSVTPLAAALQTGVAGSLRAFVLEQLDDEHYGAWGDLMHSVKTGETAFDHHFNMDLWQYRALHPEDAKTFDEAMANMTEAAVGLVLERMTSRPSARLLTWASETAAFLPPSSASILEYRSALRPAAGHSQGTTQDRSRSPGKALRDRRR